MRAEDPIESHEGLRDLLIELEFSGMKGRSIRGRLDKIILNFGGELARLGERCRGRSLGISGWYLLGLEGLHGAP